MRVFGYHPHPSPLSEEQQLFISSSFERHWWRDVLCEGCSWDHWTHFSVESEAYALTVRTALDGKSILKAEPYAECLLCPRKGLTGANCYQGGGTLKTAFKWDLWDHELLDDIFPLSPNGTGLGLPRAAGYPPTPLPLHSPLYPGHKLQRHEQCPGLTGDTFCKGFAFPKSSTQSMLILVI